VKGKSKRPVLFISTIILMIGLVLWQAFGDNRPAVVKERERLEEAWREIAAHDSLFTDIYEDLIEKTPFVLLDEWAWEFYKPFKEEGSWMVEFQPVGEETSLSDLDIWVLTRRFNQPISKVNPWSNYAGRRSRLDGRSEGQGWNTVPSSGSGPDRVGSVTKEIGYLVNGELIWIEKEAADGHTRERFDAGGQLIQRIERTISGLLDVTTVRTSYPEKETKYEIFNVLKVEEQTGTVSYKESDGDGNVLREAFVIFNFRERKIRFRLYPNGRGNEYYEICLLSDYRPSYRMRFAPRGGLISSTSWDPDPEHPDSDDTFIRRDYGGEELGLEPRETKVTMTWFYGNPPIM
jgi:hypothetical protein